MAAFATLAFAAGIGPAFADAASASATENPFEYGVEDAAPALVSGGLKFDGTTAAGKAVDAYHQEQLALSAVTELGYTVAAAPADGQPDPAYVLEVNTTGSAGYTTLSAEPYQNGQAINAAGSFDVTGWKFWSSHLDTSADGGQGNPEPLSWFEQQYPSAVVISHGIHLGSASAGSISVVSSTSFNGASTDFTLGTQANPIPAQTAPANGTDAGPATVSGIDPQTGVGTKSDIWTAATAFGTAYYDVTTPGVKDPAAITGLVAPTVATQGSVTLPAVDGGSWTVDGTPEASGAAISLGDGPHTAVFTPTAGRVVYPGDGLGGGTLGSNGAVSFAFTLTPGSASGTATVTVSKAPAISGAARVGTKLTATIGTVTPAGATASYQWLQNGAAISGATASTYTVATNLVGKKISVKITEAAPGYTSYTATSPQTAAVVAGVLVSPKPKITGTAKVGSVLSAVPGTWTAGTTLRYQWYAGGVAIPGATHTPIAVPASDVGKVIRVRVVGTKAGYATATMDSANTAAAAPGTLVAATPTVTVSSSVGGYPLVGATLTAHPGAWTGGTAFHYQWYAGTTPIPGATGSTYVIPASMLGHAFFVWVSGSKAGYSTVARTSGKTAAAIQTKAYYVAHSGNKTTYKVDVLGLVTDSEAGAWGDPGYVDVTYYPYDSDYYYDADGGGDASTYYTSFTIPNAPNYWVQVLVQAEPGWYDDGSDATGRILIYEKPAGAPDVYYSAHKDVRGTSYISAEIDGAQ